MNDSSALLCPAANCAVKQVAKLMPHACRWCSLTRCSRARRDEPILREGFTFQGSFRPIIHLGQQSFAFFLTPDQRCHASGIAVAAMGKKPCGIGVGTKIAAVDFFYAQPFQALSCQQIKIGMPFAGRIRRKGLSCTGVVAQECRTHVGTH